MIRLLLRERRFKWYLHCLAFLCYVFGTEPDMDKVMRFVERWCIKMEKL